MYTNGTQLNALTEEVLALLQLKSAKWSGKGFHQELNCNPLKGSGYSTNAEEGEKVQWDSGESVATISGKFGREESC